MKRTYFALDYDENILGSFFGTAEKADAYFCRKYGDSYMGMFWEQETGNERR